MSHNLMVSFLGGKLRFYITFGTLGSWEPCGCLMEGPCGGKIKLNL